MKKVLFAISVFLFSSQSAFALLPPFYQSTKEIKQILSDERLQEAIGSGQSIIAIKKIEDGYVIQTAKYEIKVHVDYHYAGRPGPAHYEFEFDAPTPLSNQIEMD